MKRRSTCIPYPPLKYLWRHTPKGDDHLFSAIREHCQRGGEVRVQRYGVASYSIVKNDTLWLARPIGGSPIGGSPIGGSPIGSFDCVAAAVIAADKYMTDAEDDRAQHEHDFGGDDHPRGAA